MHEASEREIRLIAFPWPGDPDAAVETRLRAVERLLADQCVEIATRGHTVFGALDHADVDRVPHHFSKTLRREHQPTPRAQPEFGDACQHFLFREPSRGEVLEGLLHECRAFGIRDETLAGPL